MDERELRLGYELRRFVPQHEIGHKVPKRFVDDAVHFHQLADKCGFKAGPSKDNASWLYFDNDAHYSDLTYELGEKRDKSIVDKMLESDDITNDLRLWKLFVHCSPRYLAEAYEKVLSECSDIPINGKVAIGRKLKPFEERLVLYVDSQATPLDGLLAKVRRALPEEYQREITKGLRRAKYWDRKTIVPPKPPFTKKEGPALYARQGHADDRLDLLNVSTDPSAFFAGDHYHLIRPQIDFTLLGDGTQISPGKVSEIMSNW